MKLIITTPAAVVVEADDVVAIQAEDESGAFGVWPNHADFVTALAISVVGWRRRGAGQTFCAVRGGLLTVTGGQSVAIATRDAIPGDHLAALETIVRGRLTTEAETERRAWAHAEQLRLQAIRQVIGYLRPAPATAPGRSA